MVIYRNNLTGLFSKKHEWSFVYVLTLFILSFGLLIKSQNMKENATYAYFTSIIFCV